ncbi:MAG TPA: GAF domain-containing protein, partial [Candidatus Acetothermia bacterium]|nr:GAF domain-containing protein [Candidatus Acetothermia bacterium]
MTELELLTRIYAAVSRGEDLAGVIRLAAEGAKSLFSGHAATVYFLENDKQHLIPQNWSLPESLTRKIEKLVGFGVRGLRLPVIEGGHYWRTIHERSAFLLATPEEIAGLVGELAGDHPALRKLIPAIARLLGYRSVLTAPLIAGNEIVGVIDVGSKVELGSEDLERFERLAIAMLRALASRSNLSKSSLPSANLLP